MINLKSNCEIRIFSKIQEFRITKNGIALPKICFGYIIVLTRHLDLLLLFHLFLVSLHTAQTFHKFDNFDNSVFHMFHFVYDFLLTDFDDEKLHPKYFFYRLFQ